MESIEHPNASFTLGQLVAHALKELERLEYSRRSVSRYRSAWCQLIDFAHTENLGDNYSDDLAVRFIAAMRPTCAERTKPVEGWRRQCAAASGVGDEGMAPRIRLTGAGCKPPQAAWVKSPGRERCGKGAVRHQVRIEEGEHP